MLPSQMPKALSILEGLSIIEKGLLKTCSPESTPGQGMRVLVVGAGMAGLAAAYELKRSGYTPVVLEARHRVGGRVLTLREPFTHGHYGEAGAMRIPKSHKLSLAYIEKFKLKTSPFTARNPNGFCFFRDQPIRMKALDGKRKEPETEEKEPLMAVAARWDELVEPFVQKFGQYAGEFWDTEEWKEIQATWGNHSIRAFLEEKKWSTELIEIFGLLNDQEAVMHTSFLELLAEELGGYYRDLIEIDGGMDRLPFAFLPELKDDIRFGARMSAINQEMDEEGTNVVIRYRTAGGEFVERGAFAIITVPFPVLRHVEVMGHPFSYEKQRAIRQLHYDAAAKILMQFKRRFWETDDDIYGGKSVTDLPIRSVYYPDHDQSTGRGVLLASYTWAQDAERWGSLSPDDRINRALENLARIHKTAKQDFEVGASKVWHEDEFAGGAYALFEPGQHRLHEAIIAPEWDGLIQFAGEHASRTHAWIQGAIESGLRAAREVHKAAMARRPGQPVSIVTSPS